MVTTTQAPAPVRSASAITDRMARSWSRPRSRLRSRLRPGFSGRLPWLLGCLGAAGWAAVFPLVSGLATQRIWGGVAAAGYLLAAAVALLAPRHRVPRLTVVLALLGAVVVPAVVLLGRGWSQSEVEVVQNSATQLLRTGSPYFTHPHDVGQYNPYLPAMALFGLPRALLGAHGLLPRVLGDARLWFFAAFAACLVKTWRLLLRNSAGRTGWFALAAVTASPLVALSATVSGVDLPLIGCCLLGLAYAERGHAGRAAVVIALACALKWTAWPVLPVALLLIRQRHGARAGRRLAVAASAGAALLVVPSSLLTPGAVLDQVIRFPLGLSAMHTPADSPLPGHLLAELGPAGRTASLVLLGLGALGVALWLFLRPPHTVVQAGDRLAAGVAVAFLLAPAGRFGYLELPVLLALWPRLALVAQRAEAQRAGAPPVPVQPVAESLALAE